MNPLTLDLVQNLLPRLDPTLPIMSLAHQPWYVNRPNGVGATIARSLQLEPASSHLVVGSIGCGKSTELLASGRILIETRGVYARYVEVSRILDLKDSDGLALCIGVADELAKHLAAEFPQDAELTAILAEMKPLVEGGYDPYWDRPDDVNDDGSFGPVLKRPRPNVPEPLLEHLPLLERLKTIVKKRHSGRLVWLLDGLDRLSNPIDFDRIVEPFLQAVKAVGIGVALVGPRRIVSGLDRLGTAAVFDELHWMGPVETDEGTPGRAFLNAVLEARGVADAVALEQQHTLIHLSGGAIRILLQLTREAIKEAWVRNVASIGSEQVRVAADKVGRGLLLGLSDSELSLLKVLLESGTFAPRSPEESALALTNRVLEYRAESGLMTHAVHPTLTPFVRALAKLPTSGSSSSAPV